MKLLPFVLLYSEIGFYFPFSFDTKKKQSCVTNVYLNGTTTTDELGINKDRYKSLADEMDSTFAELAGY